MRVAVFASGSGTNLQALLDACRDGDATIAIVLSNRADARALTRATAAGVPVHVISDANDGTEINDVLASYGIDLVVLAGYLKLIPPDVVRAFEGRMINIHPALLPSFGGPGMYGKNVHRAVLESGATVSGVTIHIVTEEYDRGPIVAQWPVPVIAEDTPETLQHRVQAVEHALLPAVVVAAAKSGCVVRLVPDRVGFAVSAQTTPVERALRAVPLLVSQEE